MRYPPGIYKITNRKDPGTWGSFKYLIDNDSGYVLGQTSVTIRVFNNLIVEADNSVVVNKVGSGYGSVVTTGLDNI